MEAPTIRWDDPVDFISEPNGRCNKEMKLMTLLLLFRTENFYRAKRLWENRFRSR